MSTDRPGEDAPSRRDEDARVFSCNRIGMRANPPSRRPSFGWLRRG